MKGEVYPFGIVGMANKGDCLQKGETVKFQLCVLGQNGQTMAVNITPFRRATVECVKDQVSDPGTRAWAWKSLLQLAQSSSEPLQRCNSGSCAQTDCSGLQGTGVVTQVMPDPGVT